MGSNDKIYLLRTIIKPWFGGDNWGEAEEWEDYDVYEGEITNDVANYGTADIRVFVENTLKEQITLSVVYNNQHNEYANAVDFYWMIQVREYADRDDYFNDENRSQRKPIFTIGKWESELKSELKDKADK